VSANVRWGHHLSSAVLLLVVFGITAVTAQQPPAAPRNSSPATAKPPAGVEVPADYVIGPDDILTIVFWREKDMSGEHQVRPDGRITLPLINDIMAAGLTPEQLRVKLDEAAAKYLQDPAATPATVVVKEIRSRKVYVMGQVAKSGTYPLGGPTSVAQMLAIAGGVLEFANAKNISIVRSEKGKQVRLTFNFDEFKKGKNLQQNIDLKPGDTIIVP
jgi:polysaccharide biosynthesis/export protein